MADYSLNEWWQMRHSPVDNPLPALQLGASIVQHRAQQDLQERELGNQIARTSLMREEMLAKQKIQTMLAAGNSEMASAISEVDDWTDDEQVSKVWATGARNPMTVGGKAWLGAQHMHESAVRAKTMAFNSQSLADARASRVELGKMAEERKQLLAGPQSDLINARIQEIDDKTNLGYMRQGLEEQKQELREILGNSQLDVDDATIREKQNSINLSERRLLIMEGNLALRTQELGQKGKRLDMRAQAGYKNELSAINNEEKGLIKSEEEKPTPDPAEISRLRKVYNLKRRTITEKFYGPATTNAPAVREGLKTEDRTTNAPSAVVAPSVKIRVIAPDGTAGFIPESQLDEALKAGYTRP